MNSKEEEYKEMFLAEALDNYEELNKLFTQLEKKTSDRKIIEHIFRITHTLKGNAMGLGYEKIADLGHVMEDVFSNIKEGKIGLEVDLFNSLYKANDKLGQLIDSLKTGKRVSYKGIRTKLSVYLKNAEKDILTDNVANNEEKSNESISIDKPSSENAKDNLSGSRVVTNDRDSKIDLESKLTEDVNNTEKVADEKSSEDLVEELLNEEREVEEAILSQLSEKSNIQMEEEDEAGDQARKISFSDLVQVPVRKLDDLLNLVGELIIERDTLIAYNIENGRGDNMFTRLQRITSDLQYGVMDVRLVQIGFLFNKFHRILRDVASIENKKVDLILEGTENEIDRNILKIMSDSLIHLVRNSVSHGIESEQERIKKGKNKEGKVTLKARNEKDTTIIEVIDDGAGIDAQEIGRKAVEKGIITKEYFQKATDDELIMLIFESGLSNTQEVTEVSGRGVGMDVVKRAADSIGGNIKVITELGKGTTVQLLLPSSMAVKGALLFELNGQDYAVALSYTEAVVSFTKADIHKVSNGLMATYLGKTISIIFLNDLYDSNGLSDITNECDLHKSYDKLDEDMKLDVLVTSYSNNYVGFVVDKLLQQKEIVEKTLASPVDQIELISGATILGNGNVCLVLDVANIIATLFK